MLAVRAQGVLSLRCGVNQRGHGRVVDVKVYPRIIGGELATCGRCLRFSRCRTEIDAAWWDGACVEYLPENRFIEKESPPAGEAGGP